MTVEADDAWLITLAHLAGSHATTWFAATLALLLLCTALGWRLAVHAAPLLPQPGRLPPLGLLLLSLAGGFAIIATAGAVFAEMAEAMDADESLGHADEALTVALRQSVTRGPLRFFAAVTRLGDVATLVVLGVGVALLLLWRGRRWLALGWSIALAGNGLLNPLLKLQFERVRPLHEHGLVQADGFSFPSGHSSGSVVAYGMLAYLLLRTLSARWHLPVLLAAAALVFSVGCSRVFLQVHYASDVLAGFASGTAWLVVCVLSIEGLRRRPRVAAPAA